MAEKPQVSRTSYSPHASSRGGDDIDHIVIHYTWSRNIGGVIEHFMSGSPKVSAHYVIGQDGELVQMVPDDMAAWHAGSSAMNRRSIGIEHCAAAGDKITEAQERTSAALIRWLAATYSIPAANIIPHVAVKSTSCPGDLFAAYGGKAGASAAVQKAALAKWLAVRVLETEPAPDTEVAMTDVPVPTATPAPSKPASQSLTVWGGIISALSLVASAFGAKWGVTPELATGVAGVLMTILGRVGANTPIKLG